MKRGERLGASPNFEQTPLQFCEGIGVALKRARRIYWLVDTLESDHREKALALRSKGFEVSFFTSTDQFIAELGTKRAGIILVSDEGPDQLVAEKILTIVNLPEVQGAKLILVTSTGRDVYKYLAGCGSFRDIIPLSIDSGNFVNRIAFASASRGLPYKIPQGQTTVNQIAGVSLPARLVWIGNDRLSIECRLSASLGATLSMSGELARVIGVQSITLNVEEMHRSHLTYRFSDALIATWSVPEDKKGAASRVLKVLRDQNLGPKCRIFIAVGSPVLRQELIQTLSHPKLDVSTALQKQSIVHEPRFFTPHVVIIEDKLCVCENRDRFELMLEQLTPDATVVVLGNHPDLVHLSEEHAGHSIKVFRKVPSNLSGLIMAKYRRLIGTSEGLEEEGSYIAPENSYSFATISFAARVKKLHPTTVQFATPFPIGNYALAQLEAPFVRRSTGRNPYVKVIDVYRDLSTAAAPFRYLSDAYICDFNDDERAGLAMSLVEHQGDLLSRYGMEKVQSSNETDAEKPAIPPGHRETPGKAMPPVQFTQQGSSPFPVGLAVSSSEMEIPKVQAPAVETLAPVASIQGETSYVDPPAAGNLAMAEPQVEVDQPVIQKVRRELIYPTIAAYQDDDDYEPYVVTEGMKRERRDRQHRQAFIFVAIIGFLVAIGWGMTVYFEKNPIFPKLSDIYSDQFRKVGPAINRRQFEEK